MALDYESASTTLDDILFENRNQVYGAYWLRKHQKDYTLRGALIACGLFTVLMISPMIMQALTKAEAPKDMSTLVELALTSPPPPPPSDVPPPPPLPASVPPPQAPSIAWVPPVITDQQPIEEPPNPADVADKALSTVTVDGDVGAPDFQNIEMPGAPGGTGMFVEEKPIQEILIAEVMPESDYNYNDFLSKNLKYPPDAIRNEISGVVYVNFQVGADGQIRDVKITKGIGYGCDAEAIRVISRMPPWVPGKQGGRPVPVRCVMPVRFRFSN
jgi:protein TonB